MHPLVLAESPPSTAPPRRTAAASTIAVADRTTTTIPARLRAWPRGPEEEVVVHPEVHVEPSVGVARMQLR